MTHLLQSYCQGRWQDGTGEQRPLRDAATTVDMDGGIGTLAVYLTRGTATALRIIAGLRALAHYLQRTAIQGPPGLLSRLSPILEET
jgi:hypothetical protein